MRKPYESYESGDYLAKNPTWDAEDSEWKASEVLKIILQNALAPRSIVEVGCGAGGVLASLHGVMPDVEYVGFDIAPDAGKFWNGHAARKISFFVGDFLQTKTRHFDILLLLDVIEHVANPFEFLSELRGRADYYIFHIPLDLSALSVLREGPLLAVRRKVGHIHYYTKGLALSLIEECGYKLVHWTYTGAYSTVPQTSWRGRLAKLPRQICFGIHRDFGVRLLGGDTLMVLAQAS